MSALSVYEEDLRPYQTHFLFQCPTALTTKSVEILLDEVPLIINDGVSNESDQAKVIKRTPPRRFNGEIIGWLAYGQNVPVRWLTAGHNLRNTEHHLVVLVSRGNYLSAVFSDKALGYNLVRRAGRNSKWKSLRRMPAARIEKTLVRGTTRTLWMSGIHRSVRPQFSG